MNYLTSLGFLCAVTILAVLVYVTARTIQTKMSSFRIVASLLALGGATGLGALAVRSMIRKNNQQISFKVMSEQDRRFKTCVDICGGEKKCAYSYNEEGSPSSCDYEYIDEDGGEDPSFVKGCACLKSKDMPLGIAIDPTISFHF